MEQLYTVINKRQTFIKWENIVERECKKFKDSTIRSVIFLTKLFSMALWQKRLPVVSLLLSPLCVARKNYEDKIAAQNLGAWGEKHTFSRQDSA